MRLLEWFLDLVFPPRCPYCHRVVDTRQDPPCPDCQQRLPWSPGASGIQEVELTAGCVSPLYYREGAREAVHRFKFKNCPGYASPFAFLMTQAVRDAWPDLVFDRVTWVPISKKRYHKRGYDQSQLLAKELALRLGIPAVPLLEKTRHTPPQSRQTDPGARRVNALDAYAPLGEMPEGATVLLVDDVVTTGATLSECARVLRTAGVEKVYCVTLARGGGSED